MYLKDRDIKNKLTRFIAGECSPEEQRVISGLLDTDHRYRSTYTQLLKTWEFTVPVSPGDSFDIDQAWSRVEARIAKPAPKVVSISGHSSARVRKVASYALRVAAVLLIGIAVFQLFNSRESMLSYSSGNSASAPVTLADGSHIYLNNTSTIKYPQKFGKNLRDVYFWGEAFFEIAHDPSKPFIIEAGEARVKVLGTSFNLKAYPESDRIEVVVNSGKVLFYHADKADRILGEVTLVKGEKGVFFKKPGKIVKLLNDEPNYLSWKTGVLVFNDTSLDKVLAAIANKYGIRFSLREENLSKLRLTATFDNESLDAMLEVLELVHNLQFINNGNDYLVVRKAG
jgi:ferric-dicitrate binding protein FerR (iron transport regulator)